MSVLQLIRGCVAVVVANLFFFAIQSAQCGEIDNNLIEKCKKAWNIRHKLFDARLTYRFKRTTIRNQGNPVLSQRGMCITGQNSFLIEDGDGQTARSRLDVYNPNYAFTITSSPQNPEKSSIKYLGPLNDEFTESLNYRHRLVGGVYLPWNLAGKYYEEWEKVPGFKLDSFQMEGNDGKQLAVMRFSYLPTDIKDRKKTLKSAVCQFDPANLFCLAGSKVVDLGGTISTAYHYGKTQNGLPVFQKMTSDLVFHGGGTMRDETVYEWTYSNQDPDEADFKISTYGFPEPRTPDIPTRSAQSTLWIWLLVVATVLGAVSIWAWKRS